MELYRYTPLAHNRNEIRLFRLLPTSADVEIEILHVDFSSQPEYEALSYAWGSSELSAYVTVRTGSNSSQTPCNKSGNIVEELDCKLGITANLALALLHLRGNESRILWIDAICINQDDVGERSKEVSKMGSIYRDARRVVVWLGPQSFNSSVAIRELGYIGNSVSSVPQGSTEIMILPDSYLEGIHGNYSAIRKRVPIWIAIRELLERDWFKRLWVFQEIKLATEAVFVAGYDCILWNLLRASCIWVAFSVTEHILLSDIFDEFALRWIRCLIHPLATFDTFTELANLTRHTLCSDPRDRLYAILQLWDNPLSDLIKPDYLKKIEDVYKEVVLLLAGKWSSDSENGLDFLRLCVLQNEASRLLLPSWVPDLSVPHCGSLFSRWQTRFPVNFAAYDQTNETLAVYGIHVATVAEVSYSITCTARASEILAVCHTWEPRDLYTAQYIAGGTLIDAFIATLMSGTQQWYFQNRVDSVGLAEYRKAYISCVVQGNIDESTSYTRHFLHVLQSGLPGRAFFTTVEGYIGLCHPNVRPGDWVAAILGCDAPLILSQGGAPESFRNAGECEVSGLTLENALLGHLPFGWTETWGDLADMNMPVYSHMEGNSTQHDPRLGDLPPGWTFRYGEDEGFFDQEIGPDDNRKYLWFENVELGKESLTDPRLELHSLQEMGLDIQTFYLI